jgi:hypothetical protein
MPEILDTYCNRKMRVIIKTTIASPGDSLLIFIMKKIWTCIICFSLLVICLNEDQIQDQEIPVEQNIAQSDGQSSING